MIHRDPLELASPTVAPVLPRAPAGHRDEPVPGTRKSGQGPSAAVIRLTDDAAQDVFARWSSDGVAIAFSADRDGDHEIYLMAPDGSNVHQVTRNAGDDWMSAWSPDGAHIAYVSADGDQHLRVMTADGSEDRRLAEAVDDPWWPTWSPDGTQIAYEWRGAIYILPVDGGDPIRLPIPQIRVTQFPSWAPGTGHRIQLRRGPLCHGGRRDEPASVTRQFVAGVRAQLLGAHSRPLSHPCRG